MEVKVKSADWSSVCHMCLSTDRRAWRLDLLSGAYTSLTGCVPLEDARVCFECRAELERFMRLRTRGQTAQWLIIAARLGASTETIIGKCMSRLTVQHIYTYSANFDPEINFTFIPSDDDSQDFKEPLTDAENIECAPECEVWAEPVLRYDVTLVPVETAVDEKTSATKKPVQSLKKPPPVSKAKNKLGLPELKVNEDCNNAAIDDMIEMFTPTEEQLASYRMNVVSSSNFKFICITCREGFKRKAEIIKHDEKYHYEAVGEHRCDICASRFPTPDELEQHRAAHYRMWRCLYTGCDFVHARRSSVSLHVVNARHARADKSSTERRDKNMSGVKDEADSCGRFSDYEVPLETGSASNEASVTDVDKESIKSISKAQPVQSNRLHTTSESRRATAKPGKRLKDGSVEMLSATDEQLAAYRDYLYARLKNSKLRCMTCLEEFRCGDNLAKHNEIFHSEAAGAYRCDICASRFPSTGALEKHRAAHYRLWHCLYPGCSYVHTRKTTVTWHRLLHDNCRKPKDKNASVDNSPGVSDTEHEEFSHTAVLPGTALSCDNRVAAKTVIIDETFGQSNSSLLERNATHDDRMEMFTVTEEQLAAYRSKILKSLKHWRYICVTCLSRFSCEEKMMEHNEKFHSERVGSHQCDICTRRFPSPDELTPHRARHYRLWRCLIAGCDYLHARKDCLLWHLAHAPHKPPEDSPVIGQCVYNIVDEETPGSSSKPRQPKKGTKPKSKSKVSIEKFVATEETLKSYRNYLRMRLKNPKTKKCMTCLTKFRSDGYLKKHIKKYHSEAAGAHRCDICECRFLTEEELAEHRARHYNMWRCSHPGCGYMHNLRTYVSFHNLHHDVVRKSRAKHPRTEPPKGPFECDICGKVFERRRQIFVHLKNHRKRCMCEVCGYTCSNLSQLRKHILAHLEPSCRPYKCEHCNKGFIDQHRLDVHIRVHTGEQPFQCVVCYSKFVSKEALQEHVQDRHSEGQKVSAKPQQFECYECGKTFKFRSLLKNHILCKHKREKPFQCNVCGAKFTNKTQVRIHMSSHSDAKPFKCDLCEASYKYLAGLWSHKLIHTALKQHQCTTCGSRFTLKGNLVKHIMTHTNEKPFECNVCEKKFIRKRNLINHLKTHT